LREAWAYTEPHRFLLFDRDTKFGADVVSTVKNIGSQPTRTAFRSPWQNGVPERWVGSCRRDLLDHVIILNEQHLKRLLCLHTWPTTTRTGLIWDSRRTRQQGGLLQSALGPTARFNPWRDSAACTIGMRQQPRLESYFSDGQTLSRVIPPRHGSGLRGSTAGAPQFSE
jgi:hypothetical protein